MRDASRVDERLISRSIVRRLPRPLPDAPRYRPRRKRSLTAMIGPTDSSERPSLETKARTVDRGSASACSVSGATRPSMFTSIVMGNAPAATRHAAATTATAKEVWKRAMTDVPGRLSAHAFATCPSKNTMIRCRSYVIFFRRLSSDRSRRSGLACRAPLTHKGGDFTVNMRVRFDWAVVSRGQL